MGAKKATHYVVFIVARISGHGALDMLRYDNCCPANERESAKLEGALLGDGAQWVILRRFVPLGGAASPSTARWASFQCKCERDAFANIGDAEQRRDFLTLRDPVAPMPGSERA